MKSWLVSLSSRSPQAPVRAAFNASRLLGRPFGAQLMKDRSGAALVEFALAIVPVLCLFFGMMQWSFCAYANLIVQHAAVVAARAEAVERPRMPDNGSATGTARDLELAITPLFIHVPGFVSVLGKSPDLTVTIPTQAKPCDQTVNTVQVEFKFPCQIPLGSTLVCSGALSAGLAAVGGPRIMDLKAKASFPNQGSYYERVWQSKLGGSVNCSAT